MDDFTALTPDNVFLVCGALSAVALLAARAIGRRLRVPSDPRVPKGLMIAGALILLAGFFSFRLGIVGLCRLVHLESGPPVTDADFERWIFERNLGICAIPIGLLIALVGYHRRPQ